MDLVQNGFCSRLVVPLQGSFGRHFALRPLCLGIALARKTGPNCLTYGGMEAWTLGRSCVHVSTCPFLLPSLLAGCISFSACSSRLAELIREWVSEDDLRLVAYHGPPPQGKSGLPTCARISRFSRGGWGCTTGVGGRLCSARLGPAGTSIPPGREEPPAEAPRQFSERRCRTRLLYRRDYRSPPSRSRSRRLQHCRRTPA